MRKMTGMMVGVVMSGVAGVAGGQLPPHIKGIQVIPSSTDPTRLAAYLVDDSGILSEVEQTHTSAAVPNMWLVKSPKTAYESVRFNFGCVTNIAAMKIWNFNMAGFSNAGVKFYDVLVSTQEGDPGDPWVTTSANWKTLTPLKTLAQATGVNTYAPPAESLLAIGEEAHWLAIRIYNNHGYGPQLGLSEVRFWDSLDGLPEPAAEFLPSGTLRVWQVLGSSQASDNRHPLYLINRSGIDEATQVHTNGPSNYTAWVAATASGESVRFDFGRVQRVETMDIWNLNMSGHVNVGVNQYDVLVSGQADDPGTGFDDPGKWTLVEHGLSPAHRTLAQASGNHAYTGVKGIPVGTDARWLAIRIVSNWGSTSGEVGLSEVQFFGGEPPPKGTVLIFR